MRATLHEGDARQVLRDMKARGEFVHSVVSDPPYGLVSVTKRFGKTGSAPAKHGKDGAFARQSRGFMGKVWDGSAIERDPEFWRLVYDVMLPGAYIVAFSSSRTYHHMAVAMEAAGFITHPMIGWTFASGFPKAHNAARAIDQALGKKGSIVPSGDPVRRIRPGADQHKDGTWEKLEDREYQPGAYAPATHEAEQWQGWHYGGQVRKPALEPIYVGQKPFSERNGALNILKHGVGAVNIDDCRISPERAYSPGVPGRWPANLIHDGSEEVTALFPFSKSGTGAVKRSSSKDRNGNTGSAFGAESRAEGTPMISYGDEGSAARFFESYRYRCEECCDHGCIQEGFGAEAVLVACPSCAGMCNDPFPFDGKPIFHCSKAGKKDRAGSRHPTVKPISLIAALARHVTPAGGRVLDPFAGSGTLGQAALNEGFVPILIEMDHDYCNDIRRRLALPMLTDGLFDDLLGSNVELEQFSDVLG